jgi:hypothetical protein
LIFHKGVSSATSGFQGHFQVLGAVRSLIIAYHGRRIITAHKSRVRLHLRDPKQTALDTGNFLPDARDKEWESPITVNDVQEFLDDAYIVQFDEDISLTHDRAADSGDRLEMSVIPFLSRVTLS